MLLISATFYSQIPCTSGFISNGTDDFIGVPDTTFININNTAVANRTIEFWFKTSDITTKQILYEEGGGTHAFVFFLEGDRLYSSQYIFANNAGTYQTMYFRSGTGDISVDTWHHIAFTLDSGTTTKWFLDGVEQDSKTSFGVRKHSGNINMARSDGNLRYPDLVTGWTASTVGSSPFSESYTGALTNTSGTFNFSGYMSMFRIWNVARTPSEIDTNKSTHLTSGTDLVAYLDGDVMYYMATGDTGDPTTTANSNNTGTSYTWTGGTSTTFTDDLNWTATSPDATKTQTVVINSGTFNPIITTEVNIGALTVDSGAELTVLSGATLNVFYGLTNNGTITVENGGAVIYHSCTTAITGTGTYNIERDTPMYPANYAYSYMSSPLITTDSSTSTMFPGQTIYYFNSSITDADWEDFTGNFASATGYAIRAESTSSYQPIFSGTINTNAIDVPLYFNTGVASEDAGNVWSTEGDNLVGNPYGSAIDWDLVIADSDNLNIDGTIYYWDQASVLVGENSIDDYKQYNLTGGVDNTATSKIGTAQGFFVRVTVGSTLKLKPTHQIAGNNTLFYKGDNQSLDINEKKQNRSWITLKRENVISPILIGFVDKATDSYDRLYDGPFNINQKSLGFYSLVDGVDKVSIQGLPTLNVNEKVIDLGFVVDQVGEYSINIQEEHIDSDYFIYLQDTEREIITDLKSGNYIFTIDAIGENSKRFKLIYSKENKKTLTIKESVSDEFNFTVYVNEAKQLEVDYNNTNQIKEMYLYNTIGLKVATFLGNQVRNVSNLPTGVYILNTKLEDNSIINKKILIAN